MWLTLYVFILTPSLTGLVNEAALCLSLADAFLHLEGTLAAR